MPLWSELPNRPEGGYNPWEPIIKLTKSINDEAIHQVPVNIQNTIAGKIYQQKQALYDEYTAGGGTLPFDQFFTPGVQGNGLRQLRSRPLDVTQLAETPINYIGTEGRVTQPVSALVPQLSGIRNVQDAAQFLHRSFMPALNQQAQYKEDQLELYNAMSEATMDSIMSYTPFYNDPNTGKSRARSIATHVAYSVVDAENRWKRSQRRMLTRRQPYPGEIEELSTPPWIGKVDAQRDFFGRNQRASVSLGSYEGDSAAVSAMLAPYVTPQGEVLYAGKGGLLHNAGVRAGDNVPGLYGMFFQSTYESSRGYGTMYDVADQLEAGVPANVNTFRTVYDTQMGQVYRTRASLTGSATYMPIQPNDNYREVRGALMPANSSQARVYQRYRDLRMYQDAATDPMERSMIDNKLRILQSYAQNKGYNLEGVENFEAQGTTSPIQRTYEQDQMLSSPYRALQEGRTSRRSPSIYQRTAEQFWDTEDRLAVEQGRELQRRPTSNIDRYFDDLHSRYPDLYKDPVARENLYKRKQRWLEKKGVRAEVSKDTSVNAQDYNYSAIPYQNEPFPTLTPGRDATARQIAAILETGHTLPMGEALNPAEKHLNDVLYGAIGDPRYYAKKGTTEYRERMLDQRLGALKPDVRAAIMYAGSGTKEGVSEFARNVRSLNEQLNTSLPTDPQGFGSAYQQLLIDDPATAANFTAILPTRAELARKFNIPGTQPASRALEEAIVSEPTITEPSGVEMSDPVQSFEEKLASIVASTQAEIEANNAPKPKKKVSQYKRIGNPPPKKPRAQRSKFASNVRQELTPDPNILALPEVSSYAAMQAAGVVEPEEPRTPRTVTPRMPSDSVSPIQMPPKSSTMRIEELIDYETGNKLYRFHMKDGGEELVDTGVKSDKEVAAATGTGSGRKPKLTSKMSSRRGSLPDPDLDDIERAVNIPRPGDDEMDVADYQNKVLHTTDADGNSVPVVASSGKITDNYNITANDPLNSIAQYKRGYDIWKRRRSTLPASAVTRQRYIDDMTDRFNMLKRQPIRNFASFINSDEGFGFLPEKQRAQLLNAARTNFASPDLEDLPIEPEMGNDPRLDGAPMYNQGDGDRLRGLRRSLYNQAMPSGRAFAALIKEEKFKSAWLRNGEVIEFPTQTVTNAWRTSFSNPDMRVRTNSGSFKLGDLEDPEKQLGLPPGLKPEVAQQALSTVKNAFEGAISAGGLPTGGGDMIATVMDRIKTRINDVTKAYIEDLVAGGTPRPEASVRGKYFKDVADGVLKASKGVIEALVSSGPRDATMDDALNIANFIQGSARDVRTEAGLKSVLSNPIAAEKLARMELTPEDVLSRKKDAAVLLSGSYEDGTPFSYRMYGKDEEGRSYTTEYGEYGPTNPKQSRLSLWGGTAGRFLYGSYIAKRMWSMAAGPVMQDAEQYDKYISSIGYLAAYGQENPNLLATAAGSTSRTSLGQDYMGKGAYEQFGAFKDIPFYLSQNENTEWLPRQAASAKMGFSIGAIASLAPQFIPGMSAAAAGAISTAGIAVGAGIIGTSLALEGMNAYAHKTGEMPEYENITYGTQFKRRFVEKPAIHRASQRFSEDLQSYVAANNVSFGEAAQALGMPQHIVDIASQFTGTQYNAAATADTVAYMSFSGLDGRTMSDQERMAVSKYMNAGERLTTGVDVDSSQRKQLARVERLAKSAKEAGAGDDAANAINGLFKTLGVDITDEDVERFIDASLSSGKGETNMLGEAANYASSFGYSVGSDEFKRAFFEFADPGLDERARNRKSYMAGRRSSFGSQIQAYLGMGEEYSSLGEKLVNKYDLSTQARVQGVASILQSVQAGGQTFNTLQSDILARASTQMGTYGSQAFASGLGASMSFMGATSGQITSAAQAFAGLGLSNQDAVNFSAAMQGDLGAASWMANQTGNYQNMFQDVYGNSIFETNGLSAMRNMFANPSNPAVARTFGTSPQGLGTLAGQRAAAGQFLGVSNQGLVDAFLKGGTRQMGIYQAEQNYNFSVASAGISAAGTRLSQQFYWGSGTWDAPGAGSMWAYEDQSRQMQYASQMADFGSSQRKMEMSIAYSRQSSQMSNQYSIAQEGLSYQRMNLSNAYNMWNMDMNYNSSLQQRGWSRQDWQYQDQMRSLNFNWQMEDMDENIRFSSGRQRRVLVRQKERAVISQNLEEEQIEKSRERQEEQWALEDERFKKQKEYTVELTRLDKEQFALNKRHREESYELNVQQREETYAIERADFERKKKEYQESYALQEQITELQREHQKQQLDLAMASAGVAAAAAASQRDYEIAMTNANNNIKDYVGYVGQLAKYDKAATNARALSLLVSMVGNTDEAKVNNLKSLFNIVANIANNPSLRLLVEPSWEWR